MDSRSNTTFLFERRCQKVIKKLGPVIASEVMNAIKDFENAWRGGVSENQLYIDFTFKPLRDIVRPFRLCEIYAGPNRKNLGYRVVIMFHDQQCACWVYAFKKQKQNDPDEINLAIARADDHWDISKGGR